MKPGTEKDIRVQAALLPLIPGKRIPIGDGCTHRVRMQEPKIRSEKGKRPKRFYILFDSGLHT